MKHKLFKLMDSFLVIALLGSLAFAQPLFDLLGNQAEFLVAHRLNGTPLAIFAFTLGLLIPAMIAFIPLLAAKIHPRLGSFLFTSLALAFVVLIALPVVVRSGFEGELAAGIALVCSALFLWLYLSFDTIRLFLKYLVPAILIFPLLFLFASRATPLLSDSQTDAGPGHANLGSTPDIIFLVLDEFPLVSLLNEDLEINRARFPNFARLADLSNWYPAATTGAEVTVDAVPEALTGLLSAPDSSKLPITRHHPRNIFKLLQNEYRIEAFETATRLCPRELCIERQRTVESTTSIIDDLLLVYAHIITPDPWAGQLPSVSNGWSGFKQEAIVVNNDNAAFEEALAKADTQMKWDSRSKRFREFVNGIEPGVQPGLFYLHSLLPHRIWRYLPDGRQYFIEESAAPVVLATVDDAASEPRWQDNKFALTQQLQRHVLQVMFTDHLLGELLDHLQERGMLHNSLIVVMGDHGISFVPDEPPRTINQRTLSDISAIPLFIKLPGQESGLRVETPAFLIDILPTLSDVLNSQADWTFDGNSLLDKQFVQHETVTVRESDGSAFNYPMSEHLAHLRNRARQHQQILGSDSLDEIFRVGPNSELIGSNPDEFSSSIASTAKVTLDSPLLFQKVALDSGFIPLQLSGSIDFPGLEERPVELAVAVNGGISAVSMSYAIDDYRSRFDALLPPGSLRNGANEIRIFVVDHKSGKNGLIELYQTSQSTFQLAGRNDEEVLLSPDGREWKIIQGSDDSLVSSSANESQAVIRLNGAISPGLDASATVVAFVDGQFAGDSIAKGSIFSLWVVAPKASESLPPLRAFSLSENRAIELNYPPPCSKDWHFAAPPGWSDVACDRIKGNPLQLRSGVFGGTLNFTEVSIIPYQTHGWSFSEGNVSWATGVQADLDIPYSDEHWPEAMHSLSFTATVQPFLAPPDLNRQQVFLIANGEKVANWTLEESKMTAINWVVPLSLLDTNSGTLNLSFLMPDAVSPKSMGAGDDLRALGLAFLNMTIEAVTTEKNQ